MSWQEDFAVRLYGFRTAIRVRNSLRFTLKSLITSGWRSSSTPRSESPDMFSELTDEELCALEEILYRGKNRALPVNLDAPYAMDIWDDVFGAWDDATDEMRRRNWTHIKRV
ncbi:hypothetical protein E1264_03415 [Actinomadura sp. KC216]|uniref:hypothetical protein n=1 Tax=Actinomadura sp. KC216 TaxID=2530370 RepID=UPI00104CE481|nr:hypothetical protein [Actinomadura sp. KC216]TDB90888.1 hypothetical protein E1264_03415 [Actinomadura sp. KC216]